MKKYILIIAFSILATGLKAQEVSVSYSVGYGSYKMDDMMGLLEYMQLLPRPDGNPQALDAAIVDNFPGYATHNINIGYKVKRQELGFTAGFLSTGGKVSRIDYSGEYDYKVTINGVRAGFYYRNYFYSKKLLTNKQLSLFAEVSPTAIVSQVKIKEYFNINPDKTLIDKKDDYTSLGISIQPAIGLRFDLTSRIGFLANLGYDINIGSKINDLPNSPKPDWSGLRISGGVAYTFR